MMDANTVRSKIDAEMEQAFEARRTGKEGRARVCARRAAGWAIRWYQEQRFGGLQAVEPAYILLQWYQALDDQPASLRQAAGRLTTRIDEDHNLPFSEDPLEDAQTLISELMDQIADRSTGENED
jgi:hypothetical protein